MDFIQYILSPLLILGGIFSAAIGGFTYFGNNIHNKITIDSVRKSLVTGVLLATAGTGVFIAADASREPEETEIIRANTPSESARESGQMESTELERMPQGPSSND